MNSKFKKAFKSYNAGIKHAWMNIGFRKIDQDVTDMNVIRIEKSTKISKATKGAKGGWGAGLGKL